MQTLTILAIVALFNNRCFEIQARNSLHVKVKLARDDIALEDSLDPGWVTKGLAT